MNIFEKMEIDHWGNIVMLNNGMWFVAGKISAQYQMGGQGWVEFSECNFHEDDQKLDPSRNVSNMCVRRFAVPVSSIVFIAEQDS